jgi:cytochrome c
VKNIACMKNCATEVNVSSALPDHAQNSHGDLAEQNRRVGPVRGGAGNNSDKPHADKPQKVAVVTPNVTDLARRKACLSCHGVDKQLVGPGLRQIAARYKGHADAEAKLLEKIRNGGSGAWGPMPMPPNPDLAESDARALVQWILAGAK